MMREESAEAAWGFCVGCGGGGRRRREGDGRDWDWDREGVGGSRGGR